METRGFVRMLMGAVVFVLLRDTVLCHAQEAAKSVNALYQAYVVAPSYEYELSGRKDRVKGYVVRLDAPERLTSPGLVILVSGLAPGEGYVTVNGHEYDLPGQMGETTDRPGTPERTSPAKKVGIPLRVETTLQVRVVIPFSPAHLQAGINEIEFFKSPDAGGYEVIDLRLESVPQTVPTLIGQTYHLLGRGRVRHDSRLRLYFQLQK